MSQCLLYVYNAWMSQEAEAAGRRRSLLLTRCPVPYRSLYPVYQLRYWCVPQCCLYGTVPVPHRNLKPQEVLRIKEFSLPRAGTGYPGTRYCVPGTRVWIMDTVPVPGIHNPYPVPGTRTVAAVPG